ncbi:MAG: hypothetical protein QW087_08000 [Methanomassiliicoccales archaeon]
MMDHKALNHKGLSAILDSLIFLAICATISIALSNDFSHNDEIGLGRMEELTEEVHRVLLETTIQISELSFLEENYNKSASVSHVAILLMTAKDYKNDSATSNFVLSVSRILAGLLPANVNFQWLVDVNGQNLIVKNSDSPPFSSDRYVSNIDLSIEISDIELHAIFSLIIWK